MKVFWGIVWNRSIDLLGMVLLAGMCYTLMWSSLSHQRAMRDALAHELAEEIVQQRRQLDRMEARIQQANALISRARRCVTFGR